jgi:predicted Fe-Mo cluster-binding NifX family protein
MKICVTSEGNTLDSKIDPVFGRYHYFIIADPRNLQYEAIPNSATEAKEGAGIQAAQFLITKQIKAVLTGNIGPNAYQALKTTGIDIVTEVSGNVMEAIENYIKGKFETI